jgi:DNA-binding transcriptional regulator YdaS (Cro superfamily)
MKRPARNGKALATSVAALRRAVKLVGSQAKLARIVKVAQPSVWWIINNRSKVPAEWCLLIEAATAGEITAHELRPDLYPKKGKYVPPRNSRSDRTVTA